MRSFDVKQLHSQRNTERGEGLRKSITTNAGWLLDSIDQGFPTPFLEPPQHCIFTARETQKEEKAFENP